jgi:hypothetical protein
METPFNHKAVIFLHWHLLPPAPLQNPPLLYPLPHENAFVKEVGR